MNNELRKAIDQGSLPALVRALESGAEIEHADVHGDPGLPLRMACFKGHAAIVNELLKRGAAINSPNAHGDDAPMRMAMRGQHKEIIRLLLAHGAKIPSGLEEACRDTADRRHRVERRMHSYGPPSGIRERRSSSERRVTFVREVELSDLQWADYFANTQFTTPPCPLHHAAEEASNVFDRIRD